MKSKLTRESAVPWNLSAPLEKKNRLLKAIEQHLVRRTPSELWEEKIDEVLREVEGQNSLNTPAQVVARLDFFIESIARRLRQTDGRATLYVKEEADFAEATLRSEFPGLRFSAQDLLQRALWKVSGR